MKTKKLRVVPDEELQPVCQKNYYDFDSGKCRLPNELYGRQCSNYPNCMYKVGFPVLRLSTQTAREAEA